MFTTPVAWLRTASNSSLSRVGQRANVVHEASCKVGHHWVGHPLSMQEGCIQDDLCKIASAGPYIALTRPMDGTHLSLENVVFIDLATHC